MTKKKTDAEKAAAKKSKAEPVKHTEKKKHQDGPHEDTDGQAWARGESIDLATDETEL